MWNVNHDLKKKLPYLEGLRGLAALVVVFRHLQLTIAPEALNTLKLALDDLFGWSIVTHFLLGSVQIFFNAELAVYLFWFLSAYVISSRLFVLEDRSYVTAAFAKRYFRLAIPILTSMILAFCLMSLGAMHNQSLAVAIGNDWLSGHYAFEPDFFSTIKIGLWGIFFKDQNPIYNPVLWTIFPEFVGSLFCFALFALFREHRLLPFIALFFAIVALLMQKYWMVTFMLGFSWCTIKYSKHFAHWHLCLTSVFQYTRLNVLIWSSILILSGIYDFYYGGLYGHYWLFHVASSAIIIIILIQTEVLQKVLSGRFCVWLGRISFGLYIVHFPILCSFTSWLFLHDTLGGSSKFLITIGLSLALCLVLAEVFTRFVDAPSKTWANRFGRLVSDKS